MAEDLEDYAPVIIGVSSRGEGKTKSGLSEAFSEQDWGGCRVEPGDEHNNGEDKIAMPTMIMIKRQVKNKKAQK